MQSFLLPRTTKKKQTIGGIRARVLRYIGVSGLKGFKFGVFTLLLFGMVIALTGIVSADQVVPAVPETQGLVTGTVASVDGLVMETDAASWSISTGGIPLSGNDPVMANYPGYNISFWESYQEFLDDYNAFLHFFPTGHLQDYLESYINAENVSHVTDAQGSFKLGTKPGRTSRSTTL